MPRRTMNVVVLCVVAVAAATVVVIVLLLPRESPKVAATGSSNESDVVRVDGPLSEPLSAEQTLRASIESAGTDEARVAALDAYGASRDARSDCSLLRESMIAGRSAAVRLRAFEVARDLALREDGAALLVVLQDGLDNPYGEVRRASIYACREHPQFVLMDELLAIVERGGDDRPAAVAALAFLDDPRAQEAVFQAAQSETLPRAERVQAVALLSRLSLPRALEYLKALAAGDDAELREIAMAALALRQG